MRKAEKPLVHPIIGMFGGVTVVVILIVLSFFFTGGRPSSKVEEIIERFKIEQRFNRSPSGNYIGKFVSNDSGKLSLNAIVKSDGLGFELQNNNKFDWENVYLVIDSDDSKWILDITINQVSSKKYYFLNSLQFKNSDQVGLDLSEVQPVKVSILADTPQGKMVWTGEYKKIKK